MLGAIAGDIIGSPWEYQPAPDGPIPLFGPDSGFTDDTVLTVATAQALLTGTPYAEAYWAFGNRYPHAGYGSRFQQWLRGTDRQPYGSWGNGSAMRVSPVGWWAESAADALAEAARSAAATHDHPEGIKGAQAVALAVYLARTGVPKTELAAEVVRVTGYDLARPFAEVRAAVTWSEACQESVPQAIAAFLASDSVESAIRLAISLRGDADTQAAIAGGIAEAFHGGVPAVLEEEVRARLTPDLLEVVDTFRARHVVPRLHPGRAR